MLQFPGNYIFTACTGRCGQHSLGDFINRFALNTLVEVEPPQLLYPNNAPFGNYLRNFQRKWVFTDEMLGRGKALQWYRDGDSDSLTRLSRARLNRVGRLCRRKKSQTYFEISKGCEGWNVKEDYVLIYSLPNKKTSNSFSTYSTYEDFLGTKHSFELKDESQFNGKNAYEGFVEKNGRGFGPNALTLGYWSHEVDEQGINEWLGHELTYNKEYELYEDIEQVEQAFKQFQN